MEYQNPQKPKKRNSNWTGEQSLLLVQLVNDKKWIMKGKVEEGVTWRSKKEAWLDITKKVNQAFPMVVRTPDQVEKRWYNILHKGKKDIIQQKRQNMDTGEGPPQKRQAMDPLSELVAEMLGPDILSLNGIAGLGNNDVAQFCMEQKDSRPNNDNCDIRLSSPAPSSDEEVVTEVYPQDVTPRRMRKGVNRGSAVSGELLETTLTAMKQAFEAHKDCCRSQRALMRKQEKFFTLMEEHFKLVNEKLLSMTHGMPQ
ncbi:hypothetical protein SK128_013324 [Halocaridina rubra]|uniref:Regulatory protein zeste n=1 Tax=Halocaridina rubra TaxID=373956 RepID=A0AAN8XNS8_HALRR